MDFWGTWCGPCVGALPDVQKMHETYKGKGVVVIGYHEANGEPNEVRKFAKEHKLTYRMGIDARGSSAFGATFEKYTILGIPTVAVIDQKGRIVLLTHNANDARQVVERLVAGSKEP